jgi:hypothetical protein
MEFSTIFSAYVHSILTMVWGKLALHCPIFCQLKKPHSQPKKVCSSCALLVSKLEALPIT